MKFTKSKQWIEGLESRQMLAWAPYAQLVNQDDAATDFASITGKGVTVADIDTGINYNLPQLGGGIGKNFKVIGGYDFLDNDTDPMDEDGHGTDTASVIAANPYTVNGITYQGVAPDAKLVALRVGTETGITDANIKKALQWVIDNYKTYGISVVNLSLGAGNYTSAYADPNYGNLFSTIRNDGIFVVAASGNSQDQISGPISQDGIAYPAADPSVFAVGAVDSNDTITTWAQRGNELDLLAPGVSIVMPNVSGSGYVTEDGTSFASPYVAGTAALIKQLDSKDAAGDIGSILMSSGKDNRDGDTEAGNTTGLEFSRLDIDSALKLATTRKGISSSLTITSSFSTALDSQGVLHAAIYNPKTGDLLYATRATDGLWSRTQIVDSQGDVGAQVSIAVDTTGKAGIAYYDSTNTGVKLGLYNGTAWTTRSIESDKMVGTSASIGFSIDGNIYISYYRRTSGDLRLASIDRDSGALSRLTIDGTDGSNVATVTSIDLGEVPLADNNGFTHYDTTVAIAYNDVTNGDVKYARLDLDDTTATWYKSVVANTNGVGAISLKLHTGYDGPHDQQHLLGIQAQIVYQDLTTQNVMYAYRNTDWFTEIAATGGNLGRAVGLSFDSNDDPVATYFSNTRKAIYTSTRATSGSWSAEWDAVSFSLMNVAVNDRTGDAVLTYLNRAKSAALTNDLV